MIDSECRLDVFAVAIITDPCWSRSRTFVARIAVAGGKRLMLELIHQRLAPLRRRMGIVATRAPTLDLTTQVFGVPACVTLMTGSAEQGQV